MQEFIDYRFFCETMWRRVLRHFRAAGVVEPSGVCATVTSCPIILARKKIIPDFNCFNVEINYTSNKGRLTNCWRIPRISQATFKRHSLEELKIPSSHPKVDSDWPSHFKNFEHQQVNTSFDHPILSLTVVQNLFLSSRPIRKPPMLSLGAGKAE